jgi:capsular polysaccharide transport system ATP-binding protein
MVKVEDVTLRYKTRSGLHTVLNSVNLNVEKGERIGILGVNGSGKSTLIRVVSGQEIPDSGRVIRDMKVSWPLAFAGGFQGSLSGIDNVRFISRIYKADYVYAKAFVEEFSELGKFLREPVKIYSSGMQARLAFALSLAIEFDCYLVDEVIAVGDARFHERCMIELFEKRRDRSFLIVSHNSDFITSHCNRAAVLDAGILTTYDSVLEAQDDYNEILRSPRFS